jgi:hypothetical protein
VKYPKPQKPTRQKLVKELDRVFSLFIRARDKFCVCCGTPENATCGHLLTRVAYSTRWDEKNCAQQCSPCNLNHEFRPQKFTSWFLHKYGVDQYDWLIVKHATTAKYTNQDLQLMILEYAEKLERMNK